MSTTPADPAREFNFTYKAMDGGEVASGVYAGMTVIAFDGTTGQALMFLNRHNGDLLGKPVGLFAHTFNADRAAQIVAAVEGTKWADLPQPTKGDVNAAMLAIKYGRGTMIVQRSFNARNLEFIRSIPAVMQQVDDLGTALVTKPIRAVTCDVERTADGLALVLTNVGTGPVVIADPRPADVNDLDAKSSFKVCIEVPEVPGSFASPPIWQTIALAPRGDAPASITLAPGQSHKVASVPWHPSASEGTYVAQARWQDYAGPAFDQAKHLPLIPEVTKMDAKPYVVRGAAFSTYTKFPAKASK